MRTWVYDNNCWKSVKEGSSTLDYNTRNERYCLWVETWPLSSHSWNRTYLSMLAIDLSQWGKLRQCWSCYSDQRLVGQWKCSIPHEQSRFFSRPWLHCAWHSAEQCHQQHSKQRWFEWWWPVFCHSCLSFDNPYTYSWDTNLRWWFRFFACHCYDHSGARKERTISSWVWLNERTRRISQITDDGERQRVGPKRSGNGTCIVSLWVQTSSCPIRKKSNGWDYHTDASFRWV